MARVSLQSIKVSTSIPMHSKTTCSTLAKIFARYLQDLSDPSRPSLFRIYFVCRRQSPCSKTSCRTWATGMIVCILVQHLMCLRTESPINFRARRRWFADNFSTTLGGQKMNSTILPRTKVKFRGQKNETHVLANSDSARIKKPAFYKLHI